MRKSVLRLAAFLLVPTRSLLAGSATTQPSQGCSPLNWKLVWSDEFEYVGLPDPTKWKCDDGLNENHEAQFYTKDRLENARVENGELVIEGRKEEWKIPQHRSGSDGGGSAPAVTHYTSARITTQGKESWCYGRIEVKAKLPLAQGVWPAFWTLGNNITKIGWPRCGEDDIMEFVGHEPGRIHGTAHFAIDSKPGEPVRQSGGVMKTTAPLDQFHVYAVEWFPDHIDWYFDHVRYYHFDVANAGQNDNSFRKPHYLILNLALGGDWGGKIDDSAFPQKYEIKFVRVFQTPEMIAASRVDPKSTAAQP